MEKTCRIIIANLNRPILQKKKILVVDRAHHNADEHGKPIEVNPGVELRRLPSTPR